MLSECWPEGKILDSVAGWEHCYVAMSAIKKSSSHGDLPFDQLDTSRKLGCVWGHSVLMTTTYSRAESEQWSRNYTVV